MKVTRRSPLTKQENTLELDITSEQAAMWNSGEHLLQECFPNLFAAEREFIKTGYTAEDWTAIFGEEE